MMNFKLVPGTLCLIEEDETDCVNATTHEPGTLLGGTPVRVVGVQELDCPARVNGECKAVCGAICNHDNTCGSYIVTVEDCGGEQWNVRCFPEDDEDTFPFEVLEDGEAEFLFSKRALRQYKLCEFTDDGFTTKTQPLLIGIGAIFCTYAITYVIQNVGEWTGWMLLALSGFVFLFGLVKVIAGHIYLRFQLPTYVQRFFSRYEENKRQLEGMLVRLPNVSSEKDVLTKEDKER